MSCQAHICCLSILVLAMPAAAASDAVSACLDLPSTAQQRQCAEALYRAATLELDEVFSRAVKSASVIDGRPMDPDARPDPASLAAAITASQNSWRIYRDAECQSVVGHGDGSGRMAWVWGCLAEKTLERIQELKVPFYQR